MNKNKDGSNDKTGNNVASLENGNTTPSEVMPPDSKKNSIETPDVRRVKTIDVLRANSEEPAAKKPSNEFKHPNGLALTGNPLDDFIGKGNSGNNKRRLVLHFDVRNTVLVADSVTNINVEQSLNSFLTGVVWGTETAGGWEWASSEPSLTQPTPDSITYYKHMEKQIVRTPSDRGVLRRRMGDFTQEEGGCLTIDFIQWIFSLGACFSKGF